MEKTFSDLSKDLVADIFERVVASSFRDLGSIRMTCKTFSNLTEEDHFYGRISLQNFPIYYKWQRYEATLSMFLEKCRQNKNPEALLMKAVVDYFEGNNIENAFECLEEISNSGHAESSYVLAIILLFGGTESKEKGIQLFKSLIETTIHKSNIEGFRLRLKKIIKSIWVHNKTVLNHDGLICCTLPHRNVRGWNRDGIYKEEGQLFCIRCLCDQEVEAVSKALPKNN